MNILKEKFSIGFTEASDSLNAIQKCDTIILNDEPMEKRTKKLIFSTIEVIMNVLLILKVKKMKRFFNYCFHNFSHFCFNTILH